MCYSLSTRMANKLIWGGAFSKLVPAAFEHCGDNSVAGANTYVTCTHTDRVRRPLPRRFTPDGQLAVVAQLNLSRLLFLAAPPVGGIGSCLVRHSIQLADEVSPHLLDVGGRTGAIYVAEIGAKQVQKYVPWKS